HCRSQGRRRARMGLRAPGRLGDQQSGCRLTEPNSDTSALVCEIFALPDLDSFIRGPNHRAWFRNAKCFGKFGKITQWAVDAEWGRAMRINVENQAQIFGSNV